MLFALNPANGDTVATTLADPYPPATERPGQISSERAKGDGATPSPL